MYPLHLSNSEGLDLLPLAAFLTAALLALFQAL